MAKEKVGRTINNGRDPEKKSKSIVMTDKELDAMRLLEEIDRLSLEYRKKIEKGIADMGLATQLNRLREEAGLVEKPPVKPVEKEVDADPK